MKRRAQLVWYFVALVLCSAQALGGNGSDHWAFQPLRPRNRPIQIGTHNPLDAFITGKSLSIEARRQLLIRRLYASVLGLPPAPEEVEHFLADSRPDAWQRLVDRLLSSPHFGEKWARHWLDVVRFAETHGFETNTPRENAWPYRDYVIRAFNEDIPYTQFVLEQLAGDFFGVDEATGFIVGGPWDEVKSPDVVLTANQRADELHDMVSTTATAFLGLTVGCARCHDHKFDPIPQTDYYAMKACFAGVLHGERKIRAADELSRSNQMAQIRRQLHAIEDGLAEFEPEARIETTPLPNPKINVETFATKPAKTVRFTIHQTLAYNSLGEIEPCIDELELWTDEAIPRNVAPLGKAQASGTYPNSDLHKLEHINDGHTGNSRSWISLEKGKGWIEIELPQVTPINKIIWSRDRTGGFQDRLPLSYTIEIRSDHGSHVVAHREMLRAPVQARKNVDRFPPVPARFLRFVITDTTGLEPCIDELEVYDNKKRNLALGAVASASSVYPNSSIHKLEHLNDGVYGNSRSWISAEAGKGWVQLEFPQIEQISKIVWGRDREEKFSDRLPVGYRIEVATDTNQWTTVASSLDRIPYNPRQKPPPPYRTNNLSPEKIGKLTQLLGEANSYEQELKTLNRQRMVYAGSFTKPEQTYRFHRGDPMLKKEEIAPGPVSILKTTEFPSGLDEQQRRLALARWIANPDNPLTARVIVNRIWQYYFGEGIVSTPSDFGLNGARPKNQELLDYLAAELMSHGWRLKHIHRLILLSATFRQSSVPPEHGSEWLSVFPARRLDAEAIRDFILSVSGALDRRIGGPGYHVFEPNNNYVRVYNPKVEFGPSEWRRMIYQYKPRMQQDVTFGAFDCPDGGQIAPKRNQSTTPLQALNLLNSPFIFQQAEIFAKRLQTEGGPSAADQVRRAFALCFNRAPDIAELERAETLIQTHGLPAFCRAMFNANEFLYVF